MDNKEKKKMNEFVKGQMQQDSEWRKERILPDTILTLGLNLAEMIPMTMVGAGTTKAPRALAGFVGYISGLSKKPPEHS